MYSFEGKLRAKLIGVLAFFPGEDRTHKNAKNRVSPAKVVQRFQVAIQQNWARLFLVSVCELKHIQGPKSTNTKRRACQCYLSSARTDDK